MPTVLRFGVTLSTPGEGLWKISATSVLALLGVSFEGKTHSISSFTLKEAGSMPSYYLCWFLGNVVI
jgi:hypothetical protein